MGRAIINGNLGKINEIILEARQNLQLMLELKYFPGDVMSRKMGRALSDVEQEELIQYLQLRGIEKNPHEQHLLSIDLQKKLREQKPKS